LKTIWKRRLRRNLRALNLTDFEFAPDPLDYAAFDWDLDTVTDDLATAITLGRYRSEHATVIRGAKSVGLTRPLACIAARDLLVYISLIQLFENDLLAASRPWVRFGRSDMQRTSQNNADSGWFRQWLQRQGQVWTITSNHTWIVESDVSNFFGSLGIAAVCEHVQRNSNVSQELVGLLRHMLTEFAPMQKYLQSRIGGLPQEQHDGRRVIAHTFLHVIDEQFSAEGIQDRYCRWVDDIVIGTDSWPEAHKAISRLQHGLETIDLYVNASKTRIVTKDSFATDYMKDENDYIGRVDLEIDTLGSPRDEGEVRRRIQEHARASDRRKAWERVLRRYYTLSRKLEDKSLLNWWPRHLEQAPGSAPQILEYLAVFRLSLFRLDQLQAVLGRFGNTYDDIEILAREYLLIAPNQNSWKLRNALANYGLETIGQHIDSKPHIAASGALLVGKFGYSDHLAFLKSVYDARVVDCQCRQQMAIILLSAQLIDPSDLKRLAHDSSRSASQHVRFLEAVTKREVSALASLRTIIGPVKRQNPFHAVVRPRGLMTAPLLARYDYRWSSASGNWVKQVRQNPVRLRDAATERWLSGSPGSRLP
jgi:hypothetical protein